ncbi:F0F1 ATP synthase subunit gamma [Candidatus Daviesbacteria bacterium]|nr:F0F1 ATP synthase subunit gamma [Candidatus Daviesbacteria bacterium]
MADIKSINQNINAARSMELLGRVYTELSLMKLNKIRSRIEENTSFADEISKIFSIVKQQALKNGIKDEKIKKAVIVLTSNYRFYGNLEKPLLDMFNSQTNTPGREIDERIVVGKTGFSYIQAVRYSFPCRFISFKKDLPDQNELRSLTDIFKNFSTVLVYYSRFKNTLTQIPFVSNITHSDDKEAIKEAPVLFEPEIGDILNFFDTQIIDLLLEQAFLGAELSRTASRLISMDQAQLNAKKYAKEQNSLLLVANKIKNNSRILGKVSAIQFWRQDYG